MYRAADSSHLIKSPDILDSFGRDPDVFPEEIDPITNNVTMDSYPKKTIGYGQSIKEKKEKNWYHCVWYDRSIFCKVERIPERTS